MLNEYFHLAPLNRIEIACQISGGKNSDIAKGADIGIAVVVIRLL
jgi:hypothetical protein